MTECGLPSFNASFHARFPLPLYMLTTACLCDLNAVMHSADLLIPVVLAAHRLCLSQIPSTCHNLLLL